jgi:hypothetical protein
MKTVFLFLTCLIIGQAGAQDQKGSNPADPFAPPAPEALSAPSPRSVSKSKRVEAKIPAGTPQATAEAGVIAGGSGRITISKNRTADNEASLPRSAKTGRTLVIQTSSPDPEAAADAEEDLSVMALILRKATGAHAEERRLALGIEVFGSSSGARNIYLQDYGALFLLGVPFPLLAPGEKTEEVEIKGSTSSDWQEAREEYLNDGLALEQKLMRAWQSSSRNRIEEYDADQVEALKVSLLEALKNASHIRALRDNDYVTVVIQGGETVRNDKTTAGRNSKGSRHAETVMTMRAKKTDIDAFAGGKLNAQNFRPRVNIQTYFRRGESSVATSLFLSPSQ